jgi:hypothetical protein
MRQGVRVIALVRRLLTCFFSYTYNAYMWVQTALLRYGRLVIDACTVGAGTSP